MGSDESENDDIIPLLTIDNPIPGSKCIRNESPVRHRHLFLLVSIFGGIFIILNINNSADFFFSEPSAPTWYTKHYGINTEDIYTIKTEGCTIPSMTPLNDEVRRYVRYPKDIYKCPHANHSLLERNRSHIWINKDNMNYYNVTDIKKFICCYNSFYRPNAAKNVFATSIDDRIEYSVVCINFTDAIEAKDEFVRVTCSFEGNKTYEQFYIFAPKKKIILHDDSKEVPKNKSSYNVVILGIDAVSRMNFHRTMPKTLAFIKEKGVVEFLGYNKIGDNSYPNIVAFLMGHKDQEIKQMCHPYQHSTYDLCPFIWHWYKKAGYYTAFGEDSSYLGTFNYMLDGFTTTPTDYYAHPFIHQAENLAGTIKEWHSQYCMHDKYFFKVLLDYVEDITTTLHYSRLFAFFWTVTMSHDNLNDPMMMDEHYEQYLKRLDDTNYLNETILILVSDHGIRYGDIRSTKQGKFEERLPFLYVMMPPSFQQNYTKAYNNLKLNSERLTTPFDLHAMLFDLVDLDNIKDDKILLKSQEPYAHQRGISLFLPIPTNRTCKMADIAEHWCTCHIGSKISSTSKEVVTAAKYLIEHLNSLVQDYPECCQLSLAEVVDATEMKWGGAAWEYEVKSKEYMVVVRATPGDGVFEATLRFSSQNWTLAGTASRLNLYGNQSRCVHHPLLKLYCYCKS